MTSKVASIQHLDVFLGKTTTKCHNVLANIMRFCFFPHSFHFLGKQSKLAPCKLADTRSRFAAPPRTYALRENFLQTYVALKRTIEGSNSSTQQLPRLSVSTQEVCDCTRTHRGLGMGVCLACSRNRSSNRSGKSRVTVQ